jgi:hypothetical protein
MLNPIYLAIYAGGVCEVLYLSWLILWINYQGNDFENTQHYIMCVCFFSIGRLVEKLTEISPHLLGIWLRQLIILLFKFLHLPNQDE